MSGFNVFPKNESIFWGMEEVDQLFASTSWREKQSEMDGSDWSISNFKNSNLLMSFKSLTLLQFSKIIFADNFVGLSLLF